MRNPSEAVEQQLKQLSIICFAIVSGVVIFGGVVWYLLNSGGFTPPEGLPTYLATLFNLVALVGVLLTGQQAGGFAMAGLAVVTMAFSWPRGDQLQSS